MLKRLAAFAVAALCLVAPAAAFDTSAKTAIIMDYDTGTILYDKDADKPVAPASMTKLMTAIIVFDQLKEGKITMDTKYPVSKKAWSTGGSKMFVELGSEIRVEDLLRGMIIQSGNDACIVLAEGIAGSEEAFVVLMNAKAREMGLTNSHFENTTGLTADNHVMSAHDLATVARYIIQNYPDQFHFYSEKDFTWKTGKGVAVPNDKDTEIKQGNRNPLLYATPPGDGMKTGHTDQALYCLTGTEKRGDQRIIIVLTGMATMKERADESVRVMDAAFKEFHRYDVFKTGDVISEGEVWNGDAPKVGLTVGEPLRLFLTPMDRQGLKVTYTYTAPVSAPVQQGQQLGTVTVTIPGQSDKTLPLVAASEVARAGIIGRIQNALSLELFGYTPAS